MAYLRYIAVLLAFVLDFNFVEAQTFQFAYDHNQDLGPTELKSIIPLSDGGYAMVGSAVHTPWFGEGEETPNYTLDIVLIRTNADFKILWSRVYFSVIDFSYEETGIEVKEKPGGGFIILAGLHDPFNIYYSGRPACLISTNIFGDVLWSRSFSATSGYDRAFDFLLDPSDTSVVVVGSADYNGTKKPWAFKVNSAGTLVWGNTYTAQTGEFRSIIKSSQSGYLIAGSRGSDVMVMNMNVSGTNVWTRIYSTAATEYATSVARNGSGYVIMINNSTAGSMQLQYLDSVGSSKGARSYSNLTGSQVIQHGEDHIVYALRNGVSSITFLVSPNGTVSGATEISIEGRSIVPEKGFLKNGYLTLTGISEEQGYLIRQNASTFYAGGCYTMNASVTSQAVTLIVSTVAPSVTNLGMDLNTEALFSSESIRMHQYIICSCPEVVAGISPSDNVAYCKGDSVLLSAYVDPGFSYSWSFNGSPLQESSSNLYASAQGTYILMVNGICGEAEVSVKVDEDQQPEVHDFFPDSVAFGDVLTITGANLSSVVSVDFGETGEVILAGDTVLQVIVPANASTGFFNVITRGGCIAGSPDHIVILPNPVLSIGVFIEGFYIPSMETVTDTVSLILHSKLPPYEALFISKSILAEDGNVDFDIPSGLEGEFFYVAVRHRNSLETWFKELVEITPLQRIVLYD